MTIKRRNIRNNRRNIGVCTAFIVFMINLANLETNY